MAQINLEKVTTAQNAPVGKLGIFVTPDNEAFLIDESGAVYAFGGGATSFLALSDVPATYVGQAGKIPSVNIGETGLEFVTPTEYTAGDGLTLTGSEFALGDGTNIFLQIDPAFKQFASFLQWAVNDHISYIRGFANDTQSQTDISAYNSTFGGLNNRGAFISLVRDLGSFSSMSLKTINSNTSEEIGFLIRENEVGASVFEAVDDVDLKGITYAADYSANFTDRSLVDKGYVDANVGASTFLELTDTPANYTGQAGKVVTVNVGETALEFTTLAGGGTVTSVAISGTDGIEVDSGSPITGSGTITLGLNATTIKATAFPEAEERENDTVLFDKNYITGNTAVRTGNILFDFTGAKLGAVTRILHNSGTKPTIPSEGILISGSYTISVNNYIWFCITDIGSGTEKVEITVSQSSTW